MILRFKPVYKERIWGGQNLKSKLNKSDLPDGNIGESWEISAHKEGESVVAEGNFKGKSLSEIYRELGKEYFGARSENYSEFPLLIKFLDAVDDLSVQVHPDNDYARTHENSMGKEEIWYVIDADPGSKLVYGLKEGITRLQFESDIKNGSVADCLNYVDVKKDDIFFIPAGTVHAIGKGIQIAEIQQSSDITYRVFDYDRVDKNGSKRQLHIEKSLDVINFEFENKPLVEDVVENSEMFTVKSHARSEHFSTDLIDLDSDTPVKYELNHDSFEILICIEGSFEIDSYEENCSDLEEGKSVRLQCGDTVLLTVEQKYSIKGSGKLISAYI